MSLLNAVLKHPQARLHQVFIEIDRLISACFDCLVLQILVPTCCPSFNSCRKSRQNLLERETCVRTARIRAGGSEPSEAQDCERGTFQ